MEDSNSGPTQVENEGISLPPALRDIPLAQHLGPSKQTWNSNEEIASLLITFEKHKDWKQREIKIRPPSGSMLLYSRNKVRYRKDGYCWKKRKDGKTIREDHMKLKVQGIECIYGSYVHSAVLPTFHRRCYWLLQNPDTVLVHYLNVPYTDNTKLTLPTLSYYMEKKEWTKEELVDQLRPMFCTGREPNQENTDSAEETIAMIVKQLLEHQDKHQKSKIHCCDALCDKNCSLRLITPKKESTQSQTSSAVNSRLISLIERNSTQHAQAMNPPSQLCPTSNTNTLLVAPSGAQPVATMANLTDPHQQAGTPLILNLSNFQGSNGIIILSGQTNTPISIINSSCTQEPPTNSGNALVHFTTANAAPRPKLADVHAAKNISETSGNVPMQIGSSAEETGLDSGIKAENHNMFMPSEFAVSASIMQNSFSSSLAGSQADLNENSSAGQLNSPPGGVPVNNCEPFKSDLPFPNSADLGFDNLDLLDFVDIEKLCPGWSESCADEVSSESIPQSTFNLASSENKTMSLISSPDCLGNQTSSKSTNCLQQQQHLHHPQTDASVVQQQSSAKPPLSLQALQLPTNPQQNSVNVTTQAHVYSQPCISQQQSPAQVHCSHPHILNQNQQTCAEMNTPPHLLGKAASIELPPLHAPQGKDPSDVGRGKLPKQNSLGDITDFSPDWSYTQGGVKVLVTGPWLSASATYSCLFDSKSVGATLVQPGVLRCFAPEHEAGLVTLQVALGDCIISNSVVFEYKTPERRETTSATPDWFDVDENQLQLMLLDRLAQLEKRLGSSSISKDTNDQSQCGEKTTDSEAQLVRYCQFLSLRPWVSADQLPKLSAHGGTVLHLAAGLGYQKLIDLLIKWRSECRSPVLDSELDANSLDNFSASPLAWACARGHVISALFLYHWNSRPMKVCNKAGLSPLEVARNHGHFALADHLAMLEQESLMQTDHSSIGTPIPCITGFLLDSPSKGENCAAQSVISGRLDDGVQGYSPQPPGGGPAPLPSLHIDIPAPHPSSPSQGKVCRRFSEQSSASVLRRRLNKRFSMEVFPDSAIPDFCSNPDIAVSQSLRVANSEPDLGANIEGLSREDNPMISEHSQDVTSPDLFLQNESLLGISRFTETGGTMFSSRWLSQPSTAHGSGVVAMDTDEISSVRSDSPFIDVEKLSDDELQNLAGQSKLGSESSNCDSQRQMVTLANQIIAAMPERIKSSPSRCDEGVVTECQRGRSESHSSVASQNSPPPSSYGDDSGISTPLGEGISFEDFRYGDIDTPASSLSPDSTCLPSPYSPYAFMLDSPPPTTAEFNEYFNAPSTFMEKDFSQLTLSDHEQRKLYEAAKLIQNAFRIYRDKQQQQQQLQKEIEAAILIQSYYRRYKQYIYYKKMTQAAVLIQSQFRSYSAQKRYKKSRDAAVVIQNQYRTYKQHERFKKSRNAAVIIQQRFRNHYQRKQSQEMASDLLQMASESNDNSPAQDASTSTTGDTTCVGTEAKKTTKTNEKTKKKKTAMLSRSSSVGKAKKSLQIDPDLRRPVSKCETQKSSAVKGDNCETSNQARRACSLSKTQL